MLEVFHRTVDVNDLNDFRDSLDVHHLNARNYRRCSNQKSLTIASSVLTEVLRDHRHRSRKYSILKVKD